MSWARESDILKMYTKFRFKGPSTYHFPTQAQRGLWEHAARVLRGARWLRPPTRFTIQVGTYTDVQQVEGSRFSPEMPQSAPPPDHPTTRPPDHPTTRPPDHPTTRPPDHPTTRPPDHPTTRLPDHHCQGPAEPQGAGVLGAGPGAMSPEMDSGFLLVSLCHPKKGTLRKDP